MSIFTELAEHSRLPFTEACMLPPAAYTSSEVLAEEHRRIFACEWMCVGRTVDLPNRGDYLTAEIPVADPAGAGQHRSIIIVRGDDDRLSAFDNVCVHRCSPLLDGCGNQARITCPYHAWVYRLDGQWIGAHYLEIDAAVHQLAGVRRGEWEGFFFVTQDSSIAPVGERLRGLTQVV